MSNSSFSRVSDSVYVSRSNISLAEFVSNIPEYCSLKHDSTCTSCTSFLSIPNTIIENGFVLMSKAFRSAFPTLSYHPQNARRRLLRMPLVALRVGCPKSGLSEIYLFEHFKGVDYQQFLCLLHSFHLDKFSKKVAMSKQQLKNILSLAQSDREKEIIRYTAVLSSGLSASGARKHFGLDSVSQRSNKVDDAINEVKSIRMAYESIAHIQERAALSQLGIEYDPHPDTSSSESEPNDLSDFSESEPSVTDTGTSFSKEQIIDVLKGAHWNWFEVVAIAEEKGADLSIVESHFEKIVLQLADTELNLLSQSHSAYLELNTTEDVIPAREAAAFNGQVVSESESDNPDNFLDHESAKGILKQKIQAIRRKCQRARMKLVAKRRFLQRKVSKRVRGIIDKYPNIGKCIEEFVQDRSVGADAWRCTGVPNI